MSDDIVIRVEGLWKRYGFPMISTMRRSISRLRAACRQSCATGSFDDGPWALRDISLEVKRGETLGIIGRNGAGKSTLLKILAGVTLPTRGRVEIHGRIFPMIELNAGLHMELTGRENISLLGCIMGVDKLKMKSTMRKIEDFCELDAWLDRPVRTYSTGMLARLGFAVAINVEADILLVDEVLAVGDLQFQNKCLANMRNLREMGKAIVFVSHSLDAIQYLTQQGILLEKGNLVGSGPTKEVIQEYETLTFRSIGSSITRRPIRQIRSSGDAALEGVNILSLSEEPRHEIRETEPFGVEIFLSVRRRLEHPLVTVSFTNAEGIICFWTLSEECGFKPEVFVGRECIRLWFNEGICLKAGYYKVNIGLRSLTTFQTFLRVTGAGGFQVKGRSRARGIIAAKCTWDRVKTGQ